MGTLNIWMNGELVGQWSHTRSKTQTFRYDPGWTASSLGRPLSLSMPFTAGNGEHRGAVVENYFENLLPDNDTIRKRLQGRYATRTTGAYDLLSAIGRDCVGAVQILPPSTEPLGWNTVQSAELTEAGVADALRKAIAVQTLGQSTDSDNDFRLSIAGAQEKTALLQYAGRWRCPLGATPTTHILKLPLGLVGNMQWDLKDSVENEWLCSKILQAFGLEVAHTEMAVFEDHKVLVVERFDRRWTGIDSGAQNKGGFAPAAGQWITRIPQEDFCQASGTAPSLKYEKDGGPGIESCLALLRGSHSAPKDKANFVLAQLAFWLLAATDGHAKNFSLFIERGGVYRMTPLYDVLSAWPIIGHGSKALAKQDAKLAMALRSKTPHYKLVDIRVRHWKALAASTGLDVVWPSMIHMVESVEEHLSAIEKTLPPNFPEPVWQAISVGAQLQAQQFLRELDAAKLR
jgi:serine/threonine-protein kinase HipA